MDSAAAFRAASSAAFCAFFAFFAAVPVSGGSAGCLPLPLPLPVAGATGSGGALSFFLPIVQMCRPLAVSFPSSAGVLWVSSGAF
eukprot:1189390-Prorocentrum_minimum.AAC.2